MCACGPRDAGASGDWLGRRDPSPAPERVVARAKALAVPIRRERADAARGRFGKRHWRHGGRCQFDYNGGAGIRALLVEQWR